MAKVDGVTARVLQARLSGIVRRMQDAIFRTGYSTIVRESQDASAMILDASGQVVGEHVILPLHVSALPEVVAAVRGRYGEAIAPGDGFITNHPYQAGVTHAMDMAVAVPIWVEGELLGWCANIAHKSDLGGVVPGSANGNAREAFQEGVLYPPVRLWHQGRLVREVADILCANSRTPDLVMGDLQGQYGTALLGVEAVRALCARYGVEAVKAAFEWVQAYSEARLRAAIASWPDVIGEGESWLEMGEEAAVRFHVRVAKGGRGLRFDFSGCSDQVASPININPAVARGCIYYALVATVDPTLPNNGGVARVVEPVFRPGSVVAPRFPAPTNTYMSAACALTEAILAALGAFVPGQRLAATGGVGGLTIGGRRRDGTPFVCYETIGSAYGAHPGGDGCSGVSVLLSNTLTAPIEILESEFPLRLRRFALRPDSGGPGQWRGGLGMVREYEILAPEAQLTLRGGKHQLPAEGIDGGRSGGPGALWVTHGGQTRSHPCRISGVQLESGDLVRLEKAGGGGVGPPAARDRKALALDILDGYVSEAAAVEVYGAPRQWVAQVRAAWEAGEPLPFEGTDGG